MEKKSKLICEYCNKKLSSIGILKVHQESAKYCLEKRGSKTPVKFNCVFCNKNYTTKLSLQRHKEICEFDSEYINGLKLKIADLETQLKMKTLELETRLKITEEQLIISQKQNQ
jgi:transcription elongation factor Elf1